MNFMHNETAQKLRGGYYTPLDLAAYVSRWVATVKPDRILEPSCGDGVFLQALASVSLGKSDITALELDGIEAAKAVARSRDLKIAPTILDEDFLGWAIENLHAGGARFDAVVGNPPFIRYQYLPPEFQWKAERVFAELNCKFTKHTNAWVPFVLASIALLRPGGRLGMVVPSELIHVLHAQSLRTFLAAECRKVVLIDPEEIWFENTLQGAVLLLAEKKTDRSKPGEGLGLVPVRGRQFLKSDPEVVFAEAEALSGKTIEAKWTRAFLSHSVRDLLDEIQDSDQVKPFATVAKVDVGIVTGANKFFLVNDDTVERFGLQSWAHPMFGRSEHCPGVVYDEAQHQRNKKAGLPANFLWFPDSTALQDPKVAAYIKTGKAEELHKRYKCRIRKNWYSVPSVSASSVGMLKRCHDAPRLILNKVCAYTTDTAYRIQVTDIRPSAFVSNFINPLTALSAELEGRTYGGGVLELVPSEIERLLVPAITNAAAPLKDLDKAIRAKSMSEVHQTHGLRVLQALGISAPHGRTLFEAWEKLKDRRQRASTPDEE